MSLRLTASEEELKERFSLLRTRSDVANLLMLTEERLIYHVYRIPLHVRYKSFNIPKKSGGVRVISAPATALKIVQQKLNQVLQQVYQPKPSVHGFIHERNIVTNAQLHAKQRYVLNVDLKDFFPSINFGRVRGMFMAAPYKLAPEVATVLAQICCFNNQLPQGAPTSPIISNMICARMDSQLQRLAQKHRCIYSRYADDLTFSTSVPRFPQSLAVISSETGQLEAGHELARIIQENGFEINASKVRLQTNTQRQEVTGLTANRKPNVNRRYVRQIRAMLHAWEKFGLENAEKEFLARYDKKHRNSNKEKPAFRHVVKGKIEFLGMVRGTDDQIYRGFCAKLSRLDPKLKKLPTSTVVDNKDPVVRPLVITEGKTDWKHLKAAFQHLRKLGERLSFEIEFNEFDEQTKMGGPELKSICTQYSKTLQPKLTICIFDNDDPKIAKQVTSDNMPFKDWGNNVYSFVLPVPKHRENTPEVCIELYYSDEEIKRKDKSGRRLFLNNEFSQKTLKHREERLICPDINKVRRSTLTIVDNEVLDEVTEENVALTKSDFAENVLNQCSNFDNFDFHEFARVFDVIKQIILAYQHNAADRVIP